MLLTTNDLTLEENKNQPIKEILASITNKVSKELSHQNKVKINQQSIFPVMNTEDSGINWLNQSINTGVFKTII